MERKFLSYLAHELRNPLATVLSSAELLKLQGTDAPDAPMLLEAIEERVRFITGILERLLDNPDIQTSEFSLPATKGPESEPAKLTDASARSVLVVDDNGIAADSLGKLLSLCGYNVAVAYTGAEGIQKALATRPEIVILDIGLPDMDGYEVADVLQRQKDYKPNLIALTGYGQPDDKARAFESGFHMHMTKPIGVKEIEAAFRSMGISPEPLSA